MTRARELANLGNNTTDLEAINAVYDAGGLTGRNLIINGAMQVAQRGTSSTTNGYASLDRWVNSYGGGGTVTQTQEALTSGDPYNDGHRNFLRATNTSAGSNAATDTLQIYQTIEAQNLANSGWDSNSSSSSVTLSAWVRSNLAGTYYVRLYIFDGNTNYAAAITLLADTWTKFTITVAGAAGNTINNDNGQGMIVNFAPYLGTDYTDSGFTLNQWAVFSGTSQAPDYAQNWRSTGSATFDITGVQLEVGETATPFEHRSYGDELRRCQRYYYQTTDYIRYMSQGPVGSQAWEWIDLPVTMRAQPTGLVYGNQNEADVGKAQQDGGDKETVSLYQSPFNLGLLCSASTSGQNLQFWKIKVDAEL